MKTEQENCTVTVRGIQRVEGDDDVVELVTGGRPDRGAADIPFSIKPNLIYSKESFDYDFPL